jgi:hypothetical protein
LIFKSNNSNNCMHCSSSKPFRWVNMKKKTMERTTMIKMTEKKWKMTKLSSSSKVLIMNLRLLTSYMPRWR